jgi:hypothetical protein
MVDSIFRNTPTGIVTSLYAENSTSFLIQNCLFVNAQNAVIDSFANRVLLPVSSQITLVDSWGFGKTNNVSSGVATFSNGGHIPSMVRNPDLLGKQYWFMEPNILTRRRPAYDTIPASKVMNVKALGAAGDGVTDDTAVLNGILEGAANTSSIVFFPFGIYLVRDTLRVPVGSRIIGQAWSQIMGAGATSRTNCTHGRLSRWLGRATLGSSRFKACYSPSRAPRPVRLSWSGMFDRRRQRRLACGVCDMDSRLHVHREERLTVR